MENDGKTMAGPEEFEVPPKEFILPPRPVSRTRDPHPRKKRKQIPVFFFVAV